METLLDGVSEERGRAVRRGARPLARGAPAGVAPAGGQERLVGLLPPEGAVGGRAGGGDPAAGGAGVRGQVGPEASSLIHRFTFPPQEHRIEAGKYAKEPAREEGEKDKGRMVWAIDDGEGWIELKVGQNDALRARGAAGPAPRRDRGHRRAARPAPEDRPPPAARARTRSGWSPVSLALLRGTAPRFGPGGPGPARTDGSSRRSRPAPPCSTAPARPPSASSRACSPSRARRGPARRTAARA
jgi:hypothetical protein